MAEAQPLTAGQSGPYGQFAARPLPQGLVLQFIPALAAMLTRAEQLKAAPLTEDEVLRIRDNCVVLVTEGVVARKLDESRGYADLDPSDPWPGWRALKGG